MLGVKVSLPQYFAAAGYGYLKDVLLPCAEKLFIPLLETYMPWILKVYPEAVGDLNWAGRRFMLRHCPLLELLNNRAGMEQSQD